MSGAEAALRAARMGDEIGHGFGLLGMIAGAVVGAVVAAAIVTATAATGGLALVAIIGGWVAGGGLARGALVRGIQKAANLPGPTTGTLHPGSTNVTVNNRSALRAGLDYADECNGLPFNHFPQARLLIAQGSRTVTVNGKPMARLSMKMECGAAIKTASDNVTVGGETVTVVEIHDTEAMFETALEVLGFVALGAAGLGALAAGLGATALFAGTVIGANVGLNALHSWGESLGPGYGDIMVGVAGFALLGLGAKGADTEAAKNAVDVLNRTKVEIEPNTLGANGGNVRVTTKGVPRTLYDQLRAKTPSSKIQKMVNENYEPGMKDPALPGLTIDKPLHADHIVSMKEITEMPGFKDLPFDDQVKVLNNPDNFTGLSETANTSKGSKSYAEWTEYKKGGIKVDEGFRQQMMQREADNRTMLQNQINDLLGNQPK
ncbi:PAAR domain-containing protein [Burkholderia stabilis]|uniref:PAAR domain-containing protein n=1 Tax=Burkholderia stabilis TaxID=95485 RepID=UPI001F4A0C25|nr:PAAR domain-containing protein [Burkholderia stabilis]